MTSVSPPGKFDMQRTLWDGVDRLIDASPGLEDLRAHGLHLLAARRWRRLQRPIPAELVADELRAAFRATVARQMLARITALCAGPIILMKGPAVAARYPDPLLRPFVDLDLLVPDASAVQEVLLGAGFQPSDGRIHPDTTHHLQPLRWPDLPMYVELHRRPNWVKGLAAPSLEDLLAFVEPAEIGVDGISTLSPPSHALVLAAHLWAHDPLTRLLRLIDVAVMAHAADPQELESLSECWQMRKLWATTSDVVHALLLGEQKRPWVLRTWGRGLREGREMSVLEMHGARALGAFSVVSVRRATQALLATVWGSMLPQPNESWRSKLARTLNQLRHPSARRSGHVVRAEMARGALDSRSGWQRRFFK